jgi:hypothetical protein
LKTKKAESAAIGEKPVRLAVFGTYAPADADPDELAYRIGFGYSYRRLAKTALLAILHS